MTKGDWKEESYTGRLKTQWLGRSFQYYEAADSTNTRVKEAAGEGAPAGLVIVAGSQSAGKGSRGRNWESPVGGGLYASLLLRPHIRPEQAPMLTLVTACAICKSLHRDAGISTQIKWPNDLVMDGKKVCGILTEMAACPTGGFAVIIGIGLNVANRQFAPEITERATSLWLETGRLYAEEELLAGILNQLEADLEQFFQAGSLVPFREVYEAALVNKGQEVRLEDGSGGCPGGEVTGVALGISDKGELLVRCHPDGEIRTVVSGEVSVRGVYGYV